jgi:hypothetical protein
MTTPPSPSREWQSPIPSTTTPTPMLILMPMAMPTRP